ncbi:extracellular solute-binding protein [Umezawaea sp. Da 62-37]|uniref:extracellular solute-binding protein n=1 Tax=Umezawaea sp. Da 62-37 TaxID=3075927 RepID=UPI0028F73161|nr:extracellular solute-binding protein [Umezawaea sp. Da 62-37]WNV85604.1 extracellular solute-binding protein [Umezawaea sp. Da 62-37]
MRIPAFLRSRWGWLGYGLVLGVVLMLVVDNLVAPAAGGGDVEAGELVILSGKDQSPTGERKKLIDQWNGLHPENPAEIVELPDVADAQHSEMVARAQAGGGDVDIYNLDLTWTAEFAEAKYILPLTGVDTEGFLEKPLASCRYEGELWALPFNSDAGLLFYRDDLIPDPPSTVDKMTVQAAGVVDAKTDPDLVAAYTGQLDDYEGLTVNAEEAIWAAGGDVLEGDEVVVDSEEARKGLAWLATGLHREAPAIILAESTSFDETRSTQAFREGKVLFMRNWPVAHRSLEKTAPAAEGKPAISFKVKELPGPSALGGQNLAISAKSAEPRAARKLIDFLTSPRSQQLLFERGGFAATRAIVYQDPQIDAKYKYAAPLRKAIESARLRPITPHYARFSAVFREGVKYALDHDGKLPKDFKDKLAKALQGH